MGVKGRGRHQGATKGDAVSLFVASRDRRRYARAGGLRGIARKIVAREMLVGTSFFNELTNTRFKFRDECRSHSTGRARERLLPPTHRVSPVDSTGDFRMSDPRSAGMWRNVVISRSLRDLRLYRLLIFRSRNHDCPRPIRCTIDYPCLVD